MRYEHRVAETNKKRIMIDVCDKLPILRVTVWFVLNQYV